MIQVQLTCVSYSPNSPGQFEVISIGADGKHAQPYTATQIPGWWKFCQQHYDSLLGGLHRSQLEGQGAWKIHVKRCRNYGHITSAHTTGARNQPATLAAREPGRRHLPELPGRRQHWLWWAISPPATLLSSLSPSGGVPSFTGSVSVL